jgi:orotidine 5'-phosphate decarboxylase subfamily 2
MEFCERIAQVGRRGRLCVGLDPHPDELPEHVTCDRRGIGRFLGALIEATSAYAVAYKPNCAFYESLGSWGWEILESLRGVIPTDKLFILDGKRGDVGHTAQRYAHAAFGVVGADAVTLSPFLGADSLAPFVADPRKGVFLLCHTSNPGAVEWQGLEIEGEPLYLRMARWATTVSEHANVGLVAGATRPDAVKKIREAAPGLPLLVPGVGAQKGDLAATVQAAFGVPYFINASRSITGASRGKDFADAAADAAAQLHAAIMQAEGALVGS